MFRPLLLRIMRSPRAAETDLAFHQTFSNDIVDDCKQNVPLHRDILSTIYVLADRTDVTFLLLLQIM